LTTIHPADRRKPRMHGGPGPKLYLTSCAARKRSGQRSQERATPSTMATRSSLCWTATFPRRNSDPAGEANCPAPAPPGNSSSSTSPILVRSGPRQPGVRDQWCTLFDKYTVTWSSRARPRLPAPPSHERREDCASPAEGTIYSWPTPAPKYYKQEQRRLHGVGFTNVSTYQVIDIDTQNGDKLSYPLSTPTHSPDEVS